MYFCLIVPCKNEQSNIDPFYQKVKLELKDYQRFKILFIDDGSTDKTWENIKSLKKKSEIVDGIRLSKNFGKDNAIDSALRYTEHFDFVILLDVDLQHPIESIKDLIENWKKGYKIVATKRNNYKTSIFYKFFSKLFFFFLKLFSEEITQNLSDFMLLDKKVNKIINLLSEEGKTLRYIVQWTGLKIKVLDVNINKRIFDKSSFNFLKLFSISFDLFASFTMSPLKIFGFIGAVVSIFFFLLLPITIFINLLNISYITLNTQILIINLFLTGLVLIGIGILSIYISRIKTLTSRRPNFIIDEKTFSKETL